MRSPPHPLGGLPPAEFLEHEQRHATLHQPARPGVAQVMPAEVRDAYALEGLAPASGIGAFQIFRGGRQSALCYGLGFAPS